ncbi:MAG: metallophosphoesterase family protein [Gemmataceae bacterium]
MLIGVVSDTHDRLETVAEAVRLLTTIHRVDLVLHCGDIEKPETIELFKPVPTHFVYGNWDKDRNKLGSAIKAAGGVSYESFGALELGGKKVAWLHSHDRHQFYQLEHANYFDYLFYGHTHIREQHRTGRTLVANPGALFRANPKTCIVLDLETGELKPVIVSTAAKSGEHDSTSSAVGSLHEPNASHYPMNRD